MGLFDSISTRPDVYLDIYIQSVKVGSRIRLQPLAGQHIDPCFVDCSRKLRTNYPIGTVFKVDCRLVRPSNRKPYLMVLHRNSLQQALEFYEHNRTLKQTVS